MWMMSPVDVDLSESTPQELLSCLKTDFTMLKNGEWTPDEDSIDASIDVIEELQRRLNFVLDQFFPVGQKRSDL